MKIVVLDHPRENPGEIDWSELYSLGDTKIYSSTPEADIPEVIGNADIVFLNKTPLTRKTLDACPNIRYISVIATGYNTVDTAAAREKGIPVSNVPSYGTEAIAQQAIALLLEITNHVAYNDAEVRKGRRSSPRDWCFWDYPNIELEHKTIGFIGLGRIGQSAAKIALAFGMKVIAFDTHRCADMEKQGVQYVTLDGLLSASDVVSLNCPLTEETRHTLNAATLDKMKPGVIILNNSRGGLIDEYALAAALESGKVAAAGLDVLDNEPPAPDHPLLNAPNCFITPHISWAALECRRRLIRYSIDNLKAFLRGEPTNIVN